MENIFDIDQSTATAAVDEKKKGTDGLYRVDLKKASDGVYRAKLRLLPNIDADGKIDKENPYWIKKIMHYVKVPVPDLKGYIDSPKTVNEKCQLADTYFTLEKHDDPVMKERAKMLSYVVRYYAYVLVVEDKQQPDMEGKIVIWPFGTKIFNKIKDMHDGNITGTVESVADLGQGHDLMLNVREIGGYPNYDNCQFDTARTSVFVPNPKGEGLVRVPTEENGNGKQIVAKKAQSSVIEMLTSKTVDLQDYAYQPHDAATQSKVQNIINYLMNSDTNAAQGAIGNASQATSGFDAESYFDDADGDSSASSDDFDSAFDD